ncbi:hypothetical protein L2E82_14518 [Cichorium intybus]|uniref:Uncharacterized protein n=1 Tax=Cichorium intybus TaxID=13427 RepID=A0ACB9F083_CICIN|nr:hypothetical protein L2E82_14518 [Cichorium intybus]
MFLILSSATEKCQNEKRKTINGDDLLWAMATLGFEDYIEPLKLYLSRYRVGISSFYVPIFWGFDLRVKLISDEFMLSFLYALERLAISDDGGSASDASNARLRLAFIKRKLFR